MKLIIGNWKMFPRTAGEAKGIAGAIKKTAMKMKHTRTVLCVPSPYLALLTKLASGTKFTIGAQNAYWEDEGAHTGEVSPPMLRSIGATQVILGHSERRAMGETDNDVAKKAILAAKHGLTIVLCVGEKARDEHVQYFRKVKEELLGSLLGFPRSRTKQLIVAYEPIWAIGKDALRPATTKDCEEMVIHIRRTLVEIFGKTSGFAIPVLYGGSVDETNAGGYMKEGKADGLLVGRASLDPVRFSAIIQARDAIK